MNNIYNIKHFSPGILLLLLLACPPAFAIKQQMVYGVKKSAKQFLLPIHTPEGRLIQRANSTYRYEYTLTDHLGNARVSFTDEDGNGTPELLQEDHYYPFGMQMPGLHYAGGGAPENKYLYNGKELVDDEGINLYDYGFRFYDAALGRWHVIDALSEIDYNFSPYSYAHNNPINSYDAMGLKVEYLYEDDEKIGYEISGDDVLSYYGYLEDINNDKGTMENLQWALEDAASSNESTGGLMASTIEEATINLHLSIDELIDILNAKPRPYPEEKGLENTYPELIFFPVAKSINSALTVGEWIRNNKQTKTLGAAEKGFTNIKIPKGFKETKKFGFPHGQKVYKYKGKYYSRDIDSHHGGVWKVFKEFGGKLKRIGTADENLMIFKK